MESCCIPTESAQGDFLQFVYREVIELWDLMHRHNDILGKIGQDPFIVHAPFLNFAVHQHDRKIGPYRPTTTYSTNTRYANCPWCRVEP